MTDDRRPDLGELLSRPREALDIEIKSWLDLSDNNQRALLAKAIIAIANHGGGYVVIGLQESNEGQFSPAPNRPADLSLFKPDNIQSTIDKFVDPPIQCSVQHVEHPDGHGLHPIVLVPGGHRTPIRGKVASPDGKFEQDRVYIRRPGPKSEQPQSSAEWDRLFEQCIRARKEELLDGIRDLLGGRETNKQSPRARSIDKLDAYKKESERRWLERTKSLPNDASPKFQHGSYSATIILDGDFPELSLNEFNMRIQEGTRNHSGWPPFPYIHRAVYRPSPIEGSIEAWFGPDEEGNFDKPSFSDFWRISPKGYFYTRKGFDEDGNYQGMEPGKHLDISTPTRRIGEILLQVSYIAAAVGAENSSAQVHLEWNGLAGRTLVSVGNPRRSMFRSGFYKCNQDQYEASTTRSVSSLSNALPEIVFELIEPLYVLFDFFQLPRSLVEDELSALRKNSY